MASTASPSPTPTPSASSPLQFSSLLEANTYRVKAIVERLTFILNSKSGAFRFDSSEFFSLCVALARGIDYALTINDVPGIAPRLPSLIKQVHQRKNESYLQPAIMVLLMSLKNACKKGWFITAEAEELLNMTNELFSIFCMTMSASPNVDHTQDILSKLVSRYYPQYIMYGLIASLEAKPGYEVLLSDFQIPRNKPPEQNIMLMAVRTDSLETSSCIISPPQVSFLINGKAVDRRTNISLDNGPQFPTDVTKILKFGTNIVQAVGYFTGAYLVALAFMSKISLSKSAILEDYVQPVIASADVDSEIIEAASRITLNCPISFRRIKTPIKGHLCNHHQCFDYENFLEMNSRKPSWRCPCCNQPVSFVDLRIDQNMVKILNEVGDDVVDVIISADGSWVAADERKGDKDKLHRENPPVQQACNIKSTESGAPNAHAVAVDLTNGPDGCSDTEMSQYENHIIVTEDRKPFKGPYEPSIAEIPLPNFASMPAQASSQLGHVAWPGFFSSSPATNASATRFSQDASPETLASFDASLPNFSDLQISEMQPVLESAQLQMHPGNSLISHEPDRMPIPRHVNRTPIAVQALPVPTPSSTSVKRTRIHGPNSLVLESNNYSPTIYQTVQPTTTTPGGGLSASSGDSGVDHSSRASNLSMSQTHSPTLQHVMSLPAPTLTSARVPSDLQRGAGAYRASMQSSSAATQPSLASSSNFRHPQASLIMSGAYHSTSSLPLAAARDFARQAAQQRGQLQAGGTTTGPPSRIPTSTRLPAEEPPRNTVEQVLPVKNWRPTGRMRGSLTGSAYSAALTQYAVPTSTAKPAAPPTTPSTSDELPPGE